MSLEIPEGFKVVLINKELLKANQKKYYEKNKEKIQAYQRELKKKKYADDPEFREKEKARNLKSYMEKKNKKSLEKI
jgi:hypothetical protein